MDKTNLNTFNIIGIAVRTTNENQQAATDIAVLWNRFIAEGIAEKIPGKIDSSIYSIYTDYEKDYTKPYTTILGCKVSDITQVPAGMIGKTIEAAEYVTYTAKGNLNEGIVLNEWEKIWRTDLPRAYTADVEVYGVRAQNPTQAEVDIFIAVQEAEPFSVKNKE